MKICESIRMIAFGEIEVIKEAFYKAKKPLKIWEVNINNVSELIQVMKGFKFLIGYSGDVIRTLILIRLKTSGYVKTPYDNELMSFRIDDEKLSEKSESTWRNVEELKGVVFTTLPVHDEDYIKTKTKTYGHKDICGFYEL